MNFELSGEQVLLAESARKALTGGTLTLARAGLDGESVPHHWDTAVKGGWTGLLADEDGTQEAGVLHAILVLIECGRLLAPTGLTGHLLAISVLAAAGQDIRALAAGERRAVYVPARPPLDDHPFCLETGDPANPYALLPQPGDGPLSAAFVPDLPGADLIVIPGLTPEGPAVALVEAPDAAYAAEAADVAGVASGAGTAVEPVMRADPTRPLGHLRLAAAPAVWHPVPAAALERAWDLAQAFTAAEALGVCEAVGELATGYAKERHAFGRAIGSYQAIKHQLVDIVRYRENVRALLYYAGYAAESAGDEFSRAAGCARVAGEHALDYATRTCLAVLGGIGATWEHDAHLYYRRGLLSPLLYGGEAFAAERVASGLFRSLEAP